MGPTAAGKTALAAALVQRFPLEIISVDSAMVYRGMDIGTGKPGPDLRRRAPHRLIDIRDPGEPYSAAEFAADARREMAEIDAKGRIPLLVGGTGLYFRALREGIAALPGADPELRARLEAEAATHGWASLHARLAALDPGAARRIHPNDPQRTQRALEVYELTGVPMSEFFATHPGRGLSRRVVAVVLEPVRRERLHRRIAARFRNMLSDGLVEEVRGLRARADLHRELPSMRSVGYRQVWDYLDDRIDHVTMVSKAIAATRQLARRQLTWLRAEQTANRFDSEDAGLVDAVAEHFSNVLAP